MVNGVYDPETENEKGGFWKPDPGHDEPSGDSSDPQEKDTDNLDDIRDSEADGAGGDTPTDKSDGSKSLANAEHSATSDGGGLYNGAKDTNKPGLFGVNKRTARTAGVIISLLVAIFGAIMSLSPFNLANFMANVEQRGFARYQVDMRGRSREWLQAYMELRFAEVEDKNLAPKDRKNLYFRSNVISSNPVKEWFLQLRGTGQFEQDMFEKHGIKFTSVAYQDGNIVKYRPGVMTLKNTNERLTFDPSQAAITAIQNGDPNAFNGELDKFINVKVLKNDKAGRQAIAQLLKDEYPHWWQAIKRYHMRQDIQRMIGVRNWRLFENKRQAVTEKGMALRNSVVQKVVDNALPEDSKSGKFIECLFGLSNCSASSDVANPDNRAYSPDGSTKQPDKTAKSDSGSGDVSVNDGSGSKKLQSVVETATISREAIAKLFKGANILSIIDSLAKFDKAVRNHKISKLVSQIKLQYVVGLYTTFKIADDQHKTGEMSSQEFGAFMQQYNGLTNGEGWTSVTNPGSSSGTASADSLTSSPFTAAKDKQEYCSQQHQDAMDDPNNVDAARKEFAYMCDKDIVGSAKNISFFENAWNNGPGAVLHPVLAAFESTAGFIVNIFNSVTGAVSSALLSLSGLDGTVQSVVGWGASKAVEIAGANMDVGVNTPPGRVGNLIMEGGAGLGEASMRDQGGALTTNVTRAEATQNYIAYQQEEAASSSFTDRYLSTDNPNSLVSYTASMFGGLNLSNTVMGSMRTLGNAFTAPFRVFSLPVHASTDDGYSAARLAQIDTYDLPDACVKAKVLSETPQSVTNADEMGLFKPDELTWDLVKNKTKWYDALYSKTKDENVAEQVWNCALADNTAAGGIGALYGYKGDDAFDDGTASPSVDAAGTPATGNAQELAKQIIDSGKITGDPRYMDQIKKVSEGNFDCNVNPTILQMLASVAKDGHTLYITSLNRKCTGVITASGVKSYHYAQGGGHAVDVNKFDGQTVDGSNDQGTLAYLNEASKYLPSNTGYGQVESCSSGFNIPSGSYAVPDTCDHQHIQVPVKQDN